MPHQLEANEFIEHREKDYSALFMETGTGKTPVALQALQSWLEEGLWPLLVVVPNTLTYNWKMEAAKWECPFNLVRFEGFFQHNRPELVNSRNWDVLVVNYESTRGLRDNLRARKFQGVVFDEMQRLKNSKSEQTKACRVITLNTKKRLGLTGTPVVHSPFDLWSEFDVLGAGQPHPLGFNSESVFRSTFAEKTPHPRLGWRVPQYAFSEEKLQHLKRKLLPHVFEKTKEQCLNLPDRFWTNVYCNMSGEQLRLYKEMRDESVALLNNIASGFAFNSQFSSAAMVLQQIKLLQRIAAGHIKTDDGVIHDIEGNTKLLALEELLPSITEGDLKCCIFTNFRYVMDRLYEWMPRLGYSAVFVDGRNSKDAGPIVEAFQRDPGIKVFCGNVQVINLGHTLTAANSIIYYSNSDNLEHRWQSEDRVYRKGTTREVTYYDLIANGSVDLKVLANLLRKKDLARMSASDLSKVILEDGFDEFWEGLK
jgi:SNF2 family DNA or RNA helicase